MPKIIEMLLCLAQGGAYGCRCSTKSSKAEFTASTNPHKNTSNMQPAFPVRAVTSWQVRRHTCYFTVSDSLFECVLRVNIQDWTYVTYMLEENEHLDLKNHQIGIFVLLGSKEDNKIFKYWP